MNPTVSPPTDGARTPQDEVLAFLSDRAAFGAGDGHPQRIETHANIVILTGDDAWKIKRAVRFPYLDFSTLELRHKACLREIEINRRFAPDLYLGCVPVTRKPDGGLEIGGPGPPVEWCVHMRRFDQADLLSSIAERGAISRDLALSIADAVFDSHRSADPIAPERAKPLFGQTVASLCASLTASKALRSADAETFATKAKRELARTAALLAERADRGFVRRCHGDLHLANIVLWKGRPVFYDAIEFDEDIASTDTLYDLAFLLMELDRHRQRPAANAVINRYLWRSGSALDLSGLTALPLFLAVRAGVRALVWATRSAQQRGDAAARDREQAATYLNSALGALDPDAPRLVAVGGLSGTGKTTLAAALAPGVGAAPGALHIRTDLERKAAFGVAETVRLGPRGYAPKVTATVYETMRAKARLALAAGHSVVLDAVHGTSEERDAAEQVATSLGVPFLGLWLEAGPERLVARVTARRNDASDADAAVVRRQLDMSIGPLSSAWTVIDANGAPGDVLLRASAALEVRGFPHPGREGLD